jgi:hypothetical protein
MNAEESTATRYSAQSFDASASVSLSDLVEVLKQVAELYSSQRFGNPATSAALLRLARALGRFGDLDLDGALSRLDSTRRKPARKRASPSGRLVGVNLSALPLDEVQKLIDELDIQRPELIRIGVERFALSRAALGRTKTAAIKDAVQVAARNERSLDAISRQAGRPER